MPNFAQAVFLLTSFASFSVLFFIARQVFPDTFGFDFGTLLQSTPNDPPTSSVIMGYFTINSPADLLAGDKIIGMLFTALTAWMVVAWLGAKSMYFPRSNS